MFPKLEKKFVFLYTLSTGLILTLILAAAFLFYLSSQSSRQNSVFQDHLFTLLSKLQTDSLFSDSYLAQLENKNHLAIYIEENGSPFFFPALTKPEPGGAACSSVRRHWQKQKESFQTRIPSLRIYYKARSCVSREIKGTLTLETS